MTSSPYHTPETNVLIRHIVEHTHAVVGKEYFRLLVKHLAEALQVSGVWVTEYYPEELKLKSLAYLPPHSTPK
jgi:ubiquinone biosynthesis protein Coq4